MNDNTDSKDKWLAGIDSEIKFWQHVIDTNGGEWSEEFAGRMDPQFPLQAWIARWLDPAAPRVRILDVGAGPLTFMGKVWPGHEVEITAVDALADRYNEMLRFKAAPVVRSRQCDTERLTEAFPENHFDFAGARNTLDHSYDPMECIRQMCRVTRPGGHIGLWHYANEAEKAQYDGLHQWNFSGEAGDMVIWNKSARHSLKALLAGLATIVEAPDDGSDAVHVILRRR